MLVINGTLCSKTQNFRHLVSERQPHAQHFALLTFRSTCSQTGFPLRMSNAHNIVNFYDAVMLKPEISRSTAEILLLPVSENKHPRCWNFAFGSNFYVCVTTGMSFCICLSNVVQIGPSETGYDVIFTFQDNDRQPC